SPVYDQTSDRTTIAQNNAVSGFFNFVVMKLLSPELHAQKSFLLSLIQSPTRYFILAAAGIDSKQKFLVCRHNRTECNCHSIIQSSHSSIRVAELVVLN